LTQRGIDFQALDNGLLACADIQAAQQISDGLSAQKIQAFFHKWLARLPHPYSPKDRKAGYRYDLCARHGEWNDGPFRDEGVHMTPRGTNAPPVPMQPGPLDADVIWVLDLTKTAGIWSHDAAHSSILIRGDHLYINSGTGVDNTHKRIRTPDAPSLVVVDKRTGRLLGRDDEQIAPNIFHCTWSSPSLGEVAGRPRVFFAAGNGVVYGFDPLEARMASAEPAKLRKVWQFDFDPTAPKTNVHRYSTNRREGPSNIYGMPVFYEQRLYVAGGGDLFWGKTEAWLKCLSTAGQGDVTTNALLWSYPLEKHVMSTPAISGGLLFIADCGRKMHCLDAATGQVHWTHDINGEAWASPLVADGKVYLGTRSGEFLIFAAAPIKQLLAKVNFADPISATATAANGVLYVATMKDLFAIGPPRNAN
jgi:outer membrane protein assembly factor BamB